jgi:hypothetical protein
MIDWRKSGDAALKKRLQQAQSEGELPAEIQPADFVRYLSSIMAGLGVQAANGATRAELRRVAEIAFRCIETTLLGFCRRLSLQRGLSFIPLPHWHNQEELRAIRQMRHIGHSIRGVTIESLKFVWMGTDNHQVWANVELMAIFRWFPEAKIHVRDADIGKS